MFPSGIPLPACVADVIPLCCNSTHKWCDFSCNHNVAMVFVFSAKVVIFLGSLRVLSVPLLYLRLFLKPCPHSLPVIICRALISLSWCLSTCPAFLSLSSLCLSQLTVSLSVYMYSLCVFITSSSTAPSVFAILDWFAFLYYLPGMTLTCFTAIISVIFFCGSNFALKMFCLFLVFGT